MLNATQQNILSQKLLSLITKTEYNENTNQVVVGNKSFTIPAIQNKPLSTKKSLTR